MTRIVINSVAQLKAFNKKLRALSATLTALQEKALEEAATDTILDSIHRDMRAHQFSEKIIDATFVGPIQNSAEKATIHFISDYVSDTGFDVSDAREEGTASGVERRPKNPDGALKIPLPSGETIFRKSSRPMGMQRLLLIEKNILSGNEAFKEKYAEKITSKINQTVGT